MCGSAREVMHVFQAGPICNMVEVCILAHASDLMWCSSYELDQWLAALTNGPLLILTQFNWGVLPMFLQVSQALDLCSMVLQHVLHVCIASYSFIILTLLIGFCLYAWMNYGLNCAEWLGQFNRVFSHAFPWNLMQVGVVNTMGHVVRIEVSQTRH